MGSFNRQKYSGQEPAPSPFYDAEMEVLYVAKRRVQANFDQRGIAVRLSTVEIATEKDTRWARP